MKINVNRKIVLLVVLAVLVCVYCLQVAFTGKNRVMVVSVKDEPDSFVIQTGAGSEVKLFKDGDSWFVGDLFGAPLATWNRMNGAVGGSSQGIRGVCLRFVLLGRSCRDFRWRTCVNR